MKNLFAGSPYTKFIAAASAFIWTIAIATSARGVQLQAARVTQVVNDVKVLLGKEAPRPVALGDLIRHGAPISTGTQSRSELTFNDLTITRLGTNTVLSFKEGTREMNLVSGAILFQVPKGSGGATIRTVGVTAAITGTTGIGEFHPATTSNPHLFSKWLCLEGTFRLYLPNGQSVELGPGQMVTTDGKSFSTVLTFDIARLVNTSLFFTGFDRPLPSLDLIMLEAQNQLASILFAPPTPNPLDPIRFANVIDQAMVARQAQTPPPPTPSKFGTPSVITSPVPYLITNGTVITTDPSITTNGVTDFGKIYRGPVDDGAFSLWAFGSTSAVDTALNFDTSFENAGHFPLAAFKFTSLVLAGNPTIDLTNGGVPNLALISVGDITSGLPGGTLTFSGLDALLLASQNGSINLGSEITFQGIPTLFFYARGTNGDLTLASPIIGTTDLFLYAGRNITFNAGTDLIVGRNISVTTGGDLTAGSLDALIDNRNGGTIDSSANLTFNIGGALTISATTDYFTLILNAGGGHIGGNAVLDISASNRLTSGGDAFFSIINSPNGPGTPAGTIGGNARIHAKVGSMSVGGLLDAVIDNSNGGSIGGNAIVNFDLSGAIDTQGNAVFQIFNGTDGSSAGRIGSDATINVNAASISTGGAFDAEIDNHGGGTIVGSANINFNLTGDLTTTGDATLLITNNSGGTIGSDTMINVTANNISTGGTLNASIDNRNVGHIVGSGSDAVINVIANNISTGAALNAAIDNSIGGTIGGNATINVTAANITANSLLAQINNTGGTINGNAAINMNVSGSATVTNDATVAIYGNDPAGSAAININGSYDVGGTFLSRIDGNGTITFANASAHADVLKAGVFGTNGVLNIGGGTLSADSILKLYAPGSNGQLNFMSNATLGGNGAKILAANSVTIFNNVVVTIGGPNPVDVFVNFVGGVPNANYTGFGGNGNTTGTFAGAGANNPQPLSNAPPFGTSSPAPIPTRARIHPRQPVTTGVINVSSSDELLSLLDDVHPGRNGRIRILDSHRGNHERNASRFNAAAYLNAARRAMDRRTASTPAMRRLPQ